MNRKKREARVLLLGPAPHPVASFQQRRTRPRFPARRSSENAVLAELCARSSSGAPCRRRCESSPSPVRSARGRYRRRPGRAIAGRAVAGRCHRERRSSSWVPSSATFAFRGENRNPIAASDRRKTVRDDERGPTVHQVIDRVLYEALGLGVQCRGRLVEDEDGRVLQQSARAIASLWRWPPDKRAAHLADDGLVPVGQLPDELMSVSGAGRAPRPTQRPSGASRPYAMFARTVSLNRNVICVTIPICDRNDVQRRRRAHRLRRSGPRAPRSDPGTAGSGRRESISRRRSDRPGQAPRPARKNQIDPVESVSTVRTRGLLGRRILVRSLAVGPRHRGVADT